MRILALTIYVSSYVNNSAFPTMFLILLFWYSVHKITSLSWFKSKDTQLTISRIEVYLKLHRSIAQSQKIYFEVLEV